MHVHQAGTVKAATQWFRVPAWANVFDPCPQKAREAVAVIHLLREWHLGGDPNERQFRALTGFGAGRSIRLYFVVLAWAKEAGAAFPERLLNVSGPKPNHNRTNGGPTADQPDAGSTPVVNDKRTTTGPTADHDRTTSRARVLLESRETDQEGVRGTGGRAKETDAKTPAPAAPLHGAHTPPPGAEASELREGEPLGTTKQRGLFAGVRTPDPEPPPPEPMRVVSAIVAPPPLPLTDDAPLLVDGKALPRDLPALLSTIQPGFMHFIRMLLPAGAENTERLLRVGREEWRFMGHGLNPAKVRALDEYLAETWGVKLGALHETKADAKKAAHSPEGRALSGADVDRMFAPKKPAVPEVVNGK